MKLDALKDLLVIMDKYNLQFSVVFSEKSAELAVDWEDGDKYESLCLWEAELRYAKLAHIIEQEGLYDETKAPRADGRNDL